MESYPGSRLLLLSKLVQNRKSQCDPNDRIEGISLAQWLSG